MPRIARFLVLLVLGVAALIAVASVVVSKTAWSWFERDLTLRAELAVQTAQGPLRSSWGTPEVRGILAALAHDSRIMGAAACAPDGRLLAASPDFPAGVHCREVVRQIEPASSKATSSWATWSAVVDLPGGEAHVTAVPVIGEDGPLGVVALAHDMSFVAHRETEMRLFMVVAFGILAASAAFVTLVARRLAWQGWNRAVLAFLKGGHERPEFRPLVRDLRALAHRLASEAEADSGGPDDWSPQRLRNTLQRHLEGDRVVIVANREPYIHERERDGEVKVVHPASGMVTALEPVMRACSGVWIAHGSGSADRETADARGRLSVPPGDDDYVLRRVWLTPEQERGYYYGFSNEGLWPLCHVAHTRPTFRLEDWRHYQDVNRLFADAVCDEVDVEDPIVLVQDYHFALAPAFIRERLPRATILTFWHIPWPNAERFGMVPWPEEILTGMLGSSILAFHTQQHCNNFLDAADAYLEARIDRERISVVQGGRATLVRSHPISIEWPSHWAAQAPDPATCRAGVLREHGLAPDALIGVGVDRLDYTKGIEERLLAVERLLERAPKLRGRFTFIQLAAPSRSAIPEYQRLSESVEALAARINARLGSGSYRPVILHRAHHEPPTVFRYYRAADVCYVSSLHDGMNLVAKEFVAAREDERGVLVLSRFTGAARELTEALVVNPYDIEEASLALRAALEMPVAEQRERMRAMRSLVSHFNVYRWAGRMLVDTADVRRRERLAGRLSRFLSDSEALG